MKKIAILLIFVLAFLAVNLAFAAQQPEMSVFAGDINYGETAHVFITLPADAEGNVTVSVNGQSQVVKIIDGKATADLSGLAPGDYKVKVEYNGAGNYSKISKEVDLKVNESNSTPANASGEPADSNNTAPANDTNTTGNNTDNNNTNTNNSTDKNDTNNTTPSKKVEPKQPAKNPPKKDHLKPVTDLANSRTGLPIIALVLVLIGCVFGVSFKRK